MSVRLSVHMSCKANFYNEPILTKLYIDAVYNQRMLMKEDNPRLKYFKGGKSREIVSIAGWQYPK